MKKTTKILQCLLLCAVAILVVMPVSLYVILSAGWAQKDIRNVAANELSALLKTDVNIGKVEIHPFNRLSIFDVEALDDNGQTALKIDEISAAIELFHLLRTGKLVVDFALVEGLQLKLYKQSADSALNIASILAALKSDKPSKQSNFDLRVNTVAVRRGSICYDVLDKELKDSVFDASHVKIDDLFLNAYLPRISNEEYRIEIDRFGFNSSGSFSLKQLKTIISLTPSKSTIESLSIELPHSYLDFGQIMVNTKGINELGDAIKREGVDVAILPGSKVTMSDFSAFLPYLSAVDQTLMLTLDSHLSLDSISISNLKIEDSDNGFSTSLVASVADLKKGADAKIDVENLKLCADKSFVQSIADALGKQKDVNAILSRLPSNTKLTAELNAHGRISSSNISSRIAINNNVLAMKTHYLSEDSLKSFRFTTKAIASMPDAEALSSVKDLTYVKAALSATGLIDGKKSHVVTSVDSATVNYKSHDYKNIELYAEINPDKFDVKVSINDSLLELALNCSGAVNNDDKTISFDLDLANAHLYKLSLIKNYENYSVSGNAVGEFTFSTIDDICGHLSVKDLAFIDINSDKPEIALNNLDIEANSRGDKPYIQLNSDFVNGTLVGHYRLSTLIANVKDMVMSVFPAFSPTTEPERNFVVCDDNNFDYRLRILPCENICSFFKLPVSIIHNVDISGRVSDCEGVASINVDAPYLLQGDKIIETTSLNIEVNGLDDHANLYATTKMPTKKGPMVVVANISGSSNRFDNNIDWMIERKIPINGSINFTTNIAREDGALMTDISFNPGTINFGDDIWTIKPSTIGISPDRYVINDFSLEAQSKSISIEGVVSNDDDDTVEVDLHDIALLDIFETLEIDKALIGGLATGKFTGKNLLSSEPDIYCSNLHVKDISYNRCCFGDAEIEALWDVEKKAFTLDADITGYDGNKSRIYGDIVPAGEALDINFDVTHIPVGFLKPFMEAFAADLKGYASGKARLFGTFKYIDMEGDIFADDLKIKIDFTNSWYGATDSIKLTPGLIDIDNVTITDIHGHTAKLNGEVRHKYFKEPSFNFEISEAHDFLSYDVDSKRSPDWYGTIYGNGGATISGEPGVVNIGVNMSTAPKSNFTFVLSDRLDADEYSFISFTDKRAQARRDSIMANNDIPAAVRNLQARLSNPENDSPSAYNMDLQIDITPDARISLVMDPISGDMIKTNGEGNLRLTYESLNNDLKMYGTYTLDRGSYNFTLQDIIIKDFTIKEGSTIAFQGDPYSAQLDIKAAYAVNANLSDLDESFLFDKDLNRTNVPVHALLLVSGDMRQPDIDFDLEFPTLTQDTYRKVRSIVSTKEMMNRQIIYLLALNRFYTPDYMASTTKGNELFSVASSTISSQLSSMLGKLSEDWSIAPNLRSDRGDFSDVEVDVALSSRLLNNRLLFNGNFGYRDKTLNTNQFIGDFDIEYLLHPKGAWRLKAYNRYNDQNYYVRTAQTTQGVGLVFKKDFDNFFNFLKKKKKIEIVAPQPNSNVSATDSIK